MIAPRWWRHVGGPRAISVWTFVLPLPLGPLLNLLGQLLDPSASTRRNIAATLLGHTASGLVILLVGTTYLRPARRSSRPWLAILTFAGIGAVRAGCIAGAGAALGLTPALSLPDSLASGAVYGAVILTLTSVLVGSAHERRTSRTRLLAAQREILTAQSADRARLDELERTMITSIVAEVTAGITALQEQGSETSADVAAALRRLSEDVVRRLSHEIHRDRNLLVVASGDGARRRDTPERPTLRTATIAARDLLRQLAGPSPVLVVVLLCMLGAVPLTRLLGGSRTVLALLAGGPILVLGGLLVSAALRALPARAGPRTVAVLLGYGGASVLALRAVDLVLPDVPEPTASLLGTAVVVPGLAMGLALTAAALRARDHDERELAASIVVAARVRHDLADAVDAMRARLARLLHSAVQGELVAAGLSLQHRPAVGADLADDLTRLTSRITELLTTTGPARVDTREHVTRLLAMWATAVPLDLDVSALDWDDLDGDPAAGEALVDALSEGLTNAIRHGARGVVRVRLAGTADGATELVVRHPGALAVRSGRPARGRDVDDGGSDDDRSRSSDGGPGLGLATIDRVASEWHLVEQSGEVMLRVVIRGTAPHARDQADHACPPPQ